MRNRGEDAKDELFQRVSVTIRYNVPNQSVTFMVLYSLNPSSHLRRQTDALSRQVMRLGFRCDESVYIDITRYFFMTTTY